MPTKVITKYVHGQSDELSRLWPFDAPQQDVFHYCLYEEAVEIEVDLDTGQWRYLSFGGKKLESPTEWSG